MAADILIVDDETDIRNLIQGILEDEGYSIEQAASAKQAYEALAQNPPQLIVLDIWLQNSHHDGLEILSNVKKDYPDIPVLMISGHGTIETAVSAIKQGAYDFIEKPFKSDRLILMIERALENAKLKKENKALRAKAEGPSDLIGSSPAMAGLRQIIERVAHTNSRVLITGEPGTGKEVVARNIHRMSSRAKAPFVVLNCATMHPDHLEKELFGQGGHAGFLEQAHTGTLFLDEVSDMPLETQGKVVRVLQEQKFQRLGGQDHIEVDVRIIASTNRDLLEEVQAKRFRQDLFYRLNVVPVPIPPLRQMSADIEDLAYYFMNVLAAQSGLPCFSFSKAALAMLQAYSWPGNVRQLRNMIEQIMIMGGTIEDEGRIVGVEHLPVDITSDSLQKNTKRSGDDLMSLPLRESREVFEKEYLEFQVRRFGGNISKTAEFIGMERSALHRKIKLLGICTADKKDEDGDKDKTVQDNRRRA